MLLFLQTCAGDSDNKPLCEPHIITVRTCVNHYTRPSTTARRRLFFRARVVLPSVSLHFPCRTTPTLCAWMYVLKTKCILSGRDLDSSLRCLYSHNCPIIYPSPCSGLVVPFLPRGGMTFPPEFDENES